tara:strand:- start:129 stop:413 length:285 start_codon:yes stop_codon:yes gene_type:complete
MTLKDRLNAGQITNEEFDVLSQHEADKAATDEAQEWLNKLKKAPLQVKRQMVKEQSLNMQIEASLMEDGFEAKAKSKKAWNLRKSLRGAGGISF